MFVIAVLVAWMADMRDSTSRRYASLFRQASERLLTVEEDERRRIAGELHDGVGQVLTALTLTLDAAERRAGSPAPRRARRARREGSPTPRWPGRATCRIACGRRASRSAGWSRPCATWPRSRASRWASRPTPTPAIRDLLGPTATVEVYRIIQEALANAARHSGARGAQRVDRARGTSD